MSASMLSFMRREEASASSLTHLMKYGLSRNYWNDYLMDSYVNHLHDMIMLAGIPDVPASLPHARENKP